MGFLLLLMPSGMPGRILGVIWILPVLLYQSPKPHLGEYWLNMLDVGQGLSVVIQTAQHTLVYDAGPKFSASFDLGESVVLPFLRKAKTNKIDMLVISHADNDHIGGAQAILNAYPDTLIKTSAPEKFISADFCKLDDAWEWDKVKFKFLYPVSKQTNSRNDNSCVLMIDNGQHKTLLTGDIEKSAENKLLELMPEKLKADIIIAPHHGSKTSGMEKFIFAVNPKFILYATGYRNRYHFPHPSVLKTYEKVHAKPFNSVDSGAIRFVIPSDGKIDMPERYRVMSKKYWFDFPSISSNWLI
jgi:competence protein ComEC